MDAPDTLPATLFGASSSHAETYFNVNNFVWSLHYNLLFQPTGLAMPDPFFFCPLVHEYLISKNSSWLEEGLKHDLVIPYIRDPRLESFEAVLNNQLRNVDIDRRVEIINRLGGVDAAIRRNRKFWPEGMGEKFQKRVEERILKIPGKLDYYPASFKCRFPSLKPFFEEDIGAALARANPGDGLRVTYILQAAAKRLLPREQDTHNLELPTLLAKLRKEYPDKHFDDDAYLFFKIIAGLYNENLSASLGVGGCIPGYDLWSEFFSADVAEPSAKITDGLSLDRVTADISLPSVDMLRTLPFEFVIKARTNKFFKEYKTALWHWKQCSSQKTADDLRDTLIAYTRVQTH